MPKKPPQSDFRNLISELLDEQGVALMNGVLEQLIHFSHGFVTQLRSTAQDLTSGSEAVTLEHIRLANDLRSFPQSRIQQQDIHRLASRVNTRSFPKIDPHQGLSLPHEEHCLLTDNYQYGKLDDGDMPHQPNETSGKKRKGDGEDTSQQQQQNSSRKTKSIKRETVDYQKLEKEIAAVLEVSTQSAEQEEGERGRKLSDASLAKDEEKEENAAPLDRVEEDMNQLEGEAVERDSLNTANRIKGFHEDRKLDSSHKALKFDEEKLHRERKKSADII